MSKRVSVSSVAVLMLIVIPVVFIIAYNTDVFSDLWTSIMNREVSEEVTQKDLTSRTYNSVEEFELAHNISLLLPTGLPNGLEINKIVYCERRLNIKYTEETWLAIEFDTNLPDTEGAEIHERNEIVFYVFLDGGVIWWEYDGNFYRFTLDCQYGISEYAVMIIENIR